MSLTPLLQKAVIQRKALRRENNLAFMFRKEKSAVEEKWGEELSRMK